MHTEKLKIFDEYAERKGFNDWSDLKSECDENLMTEDEFLIFMFEACDLVQQEQQKRIAENQRKIFYKFFEEGKGDSPEIVVQANSNQNAYKEAYSHLGPITEDLFYQQLTDQETLMLENNLIK